MPVQSLQFLGSNIDSKECQLTIPETRIEKVLKVLNEINSDLKARGKVFVKKVASFVGHIISMTIVIGHISPIMTKSLSVDITKVNTWCSCIILSEESKEQLKFWQQNIRYLNCKKMFSVSSFSQIIYSDASATGYAGYQIYTLNKAVHGMWSPDEIVKSSTWRELSAVYRVLRSLVDSLKYSTVKCGHLLYCFKRIDEKTFTRDSVTYFLYASRIQFS